MIPVKNKRLACLAFLACAVSNSYSEEADDIQQSLNEQVLSKPFSVADDATLTQSLNTATERGKPSKPAVGEGYYQRYYGGYYGGYYSAPYIGYSIPSYTRYYRPYYHWYNW